MLTAAGGGPVPDARSDRALAAWLAAGAAGFLLAPWYALPDSVLSTGWLMHWLAKDNAPAWWQAWAWQ